MTDERRAGLPLYLRPYPERQAARAQLGLTLELVTNAIRVVAWRERLILEAVDGAESAWVVQRLAGEWELASADAEEAEALFWNAATEYADAHLRARAFQNLEG